MSLFINTLQDIVSLTINVILEYQFIMWNIYIVEYYDTIYVYTQSLSSIVYRQSFLILFLKSIKLLYFNA